MYDDFLKYGTWYVEQTVPIPLDETLLPKLHSIRDDKHDRWHAGRMIHPVINNRSKNQFQFAPAFPCVSVQKIDISSNPVMMVSESVKVDNRFLSYKEVETLAINDGFNSIVDFFAWFNEGYTGKIIHWTNLKY